jgi:hypothetical protein
MSIETEKRIPTNAMINVLLSHGYSLVVSRKILLQATHTRDKFGPYHYNPDEVLSIAPQVKSEHDSAIKVRYKYLPVCADDGRKYPAWGRQWTKEEERQFNIDHPWDRNIIAGFHAALRRIREDSNEYQA